MSLLLVIKLLVNFNISSYVLSLQQVRVCDCLPDIKNVNTNMKKGVEKVSRFEHILQHIRLEAYLKTKN